MVPKDVPSDLESNLSVDDTDIVQYSEARIKYPTEKLPIGEMLTLVNIGDNGEIDPSIDNEPEETPDDYEIYEGRVSTAGASLEEARQVIDEFLEDKLRTNFAISKLSEKEGWCPRFSARYFVIRRKSEANRIIQLSGGAEEKVKYRPLNSEVV